ncbi:MAG: hypothetical protein H6673_07735 [Anaerolineales bacterium]|nr:hypothetical protein [Anaerolineales bacterium]
MSALEQEVIEKFLQLDEQAQQRVLVVLNSHQDDVQPKLSLGEWLARASAFREQLAATYGPDYEVGSQALLDELREEAS